MRVACVGSRKTRPPYTELQTEFVKATCRAGFTVVAGFALFARGVLVAQSAKDGGAMNAFRFAVEQKKPVATFAADDAADTSGNRLISAESWTKTLAGRDGNSEVYEEWLRLYPSPGHVSRAP